MSNSSTRANLLQNKRALFAKLNLISLTTPDPIDAIPDPGREASERAFKRRNTSSTTQSARLPEESVKVRRTIDGSIPGIEKATAISRPAVIQAVETRAAITAKTGTATTAIATKPSVPTRGTRGRKRKVEEPEIIAQIPTATMQTRKRRVPNPPFKPVVPQAQQVFRDKNFYFFPNLATNAARRLRISKAQEYGATWIQDFNETVSHVVVDKGINFSEILRFLNLETLPESVAVVSEDYPAFCIAHRTLLDPRQDQFRVKGYVLRDAAKGTGRAKGRPERDGESAMVLKPAGKDVYVAAQD